MQCVKGVKELFLCLFLTGDKLNIVNKQNIKVTKTAKFKNVIKDASMKIEFVILDADDKDVTFNYEITEEWGTITIKPRPITIKTESYDAVYDGKDHNLNNVEIVKGSLCTGHKSVVGDAIYRDVVTNVDNEVTFTIFDEKEVDVTENYEITVILGKVTIHKKVVLVNTESKTWNYDGKEHYHKKYSIVSGYDVIEWHSLEIKSYPTIKEALDAAEHSGIRAVMLLADGYPEAKTTVSTEDAERLLSLGLSLYIEYPEGNDALGIVGIGFVLSVFFNTKLLL